MSETILDLKGLKCPLPALKARKALKSVAPGARLRVICTDPMAAIDIPNLIRETGDVLVSQEVDETMLSFVIQKAA
jgi:tRNA 2-thiouridine synthesizing protein A